MASKFPITNSYKSELQTGGVAREYAIAQGKINELPVGTYKVCFATRTSGGESSADFKMLAKEITISPTPVTTPTLSVPDTIDLGADLHVRWSAGSALDPVRSAPGSWIGLYKRKDCSTFAVDVHKCWLSMREVQVNATEGTVVFSRFDYKDPGDYDVRYFTGDTRHGQGVVCRGLKEISETYLQCTLEAFVTSRTIFVDAEDNGPEEGTQLPGLEATFETAAEETYELPNGIS